MHNLTTNRNLVSKVANILNAKYVPAVSCATQNIVKPLRGWKMVQNGGEKDWTKQRGLYKNMGPIKMLIII